MRITFLYCEKNSTEQKFRQKIPVVLCRRLTFFNSSMPEKDVMYACACVPLTGILNNFPASTFDVPSKPPKKSCKKKIQIKIRSFLTC